MDDRGLGGNVRLTPRPWHRGRRYQVCRRAPGQRGDRAGAEPRRDCAVPLFCPRSDRHRRERGFRAARPGPLQSAARRAYHGHLVGAIGGFEDRDSDPVHDGPGRPAGFAALRHHQPHQYRRYDPLRCGDGRRLAAWRRRTWPGGSQYRRYARNASMGYWVHPQHHAGAAFRVARREAPAGADSHLVQFAALRDGSLGLPADKD